MKIEDIIKKGLENPIKNIRTSNKSFSYNSNGNIFFSYNKEICYMDKNSNTMFIYGLTAKYNNFYSITTSNHFSKILNYCINNNIDYEIIEE